MFYPSLYPLLFFPAHGKILAWAGRKNTMGNCQHYLQLFISFFAIHYYKIVAIIAHDS